MLYHFPEDRTIAPLPLPVPLPREQDTLNCQTLLYIVLPLNPSVYYHRRFGGRHPHMLLLPPFFLKKIFLYTIIGHGPKSSKPAVLPHPSWPAKPEQHDNARQSCLVEVSIDQAVFTEDQKALDSERSFVPCLFRYCALAVHSFYPSPCRSCDHSGA